MLKNHIKLALRNFARYKAVFTINMMGLAVGMACSMIIYLWVTDEYNMNKFHANGERLYQLYTQMYVNDQVTGAGGGTPAPLAVELKKQVPEVEKATVFSLIPFTAVFQAGDKASKIEGSRAGVDFFSMFSYPVIHGNSATALDKPTDIAVSRKMAELFFGSPEAAVGKIIRYENRKDLMVSAVFENLPSSSSEKFEFVMNSDTWIEDNPFNKEWDVTFSRTYIQLRPDADPAKVQAKIANLLQPHLSNPAHIRQELGMQLFKEVYLYSGFKNGVPSGGRIEYLKIFSGVGIFLLLIACINFMNLATARAAKRAKEVGVRKVSGSSRGDLVVQFIGEAVLLTLFALVVAIAMVALLLPAFNGMTEKQLTIPLLSASFWLMLGVMVLVTGFVAGTYPAVFLSSLEPIRVLKGTLQYGRKASTFRKALVVCQFTISTVLIVAMLVISRQTNYLQTKDLGYNREDMFYLPLEGELLTKYAVFKQQAGSLPGIKYLDRSSQKPHSMGFGTTAVTWEGKDPTVVIDFVPTSVGYDFIKLMGLKIKEGRDFSKHMAMDSTNYIVSELAVKRMGFKNALGKQIVVFGKKGTIIGIVKDFHISSLQMPIRPLILNLNESQDFGTVVVRAQPGKAKEALESLEKAWKAFNPAFPFTYSFLDEEYRRFYQSEQATANLAYTFALIAILISCFGLLGLAMFSAEQRVKEIGIRKVLGATESNIITMFSTDFLKLSFIAFLIAAPVAWFLMNRWLQGYPYRINLAWWIFALAGGLAMVVTLLAVGFQAIRAALSNPARSMRTE